MLVKDVMTTKVHTLFISDSYSKIVNLLVSRKITGVPVVNKSGKVVGVISEKDLFFRLFPSQKRFYKNPEYYMNFEHLEDESRKISKLKARDFMSRKLITVSPEDNILKACSLCLIYNIRRLVLDRGKLVGIGHQQYL
jgi:CBS domain-containing protein